MITTPLPRQTGLTITELLISMALGVFLVGGVISVFLGGLTTFRTNDSLSRIQEGARFAMELMRRDLRQAGYYGCRQSLAPETPRAQTTLTPGFIRNTLFPGPSGGSDALAWEHRFGLPLDGFSAANTAGGAGWTLAIPTNTLISGALDHSDILAATHTRGNGRTATHTGGTPPGDDPVVIDANNLEQFDILFVSDCTSAAVFQLTSASASVSLEHALSAGTPGNYTTALGRSFAGADVYEITKSAYYVANSLVTGRPSLFRNGDELIENVERLRIFFGIDTNDDRRIDSFISAGTAPLEGSASVDPDWERVIAVQVHLLISSGEEDGLTELPVSVPFAGGTFTATDNRAYQSFTTTIGVRNRLP